MLSKPQIALLASLSLLAADAPAFAQNAQVSTAKELAPATSDAELKKCQDLFTRSIEIGLKEQVDKDALSLCMAKYKGPIKTPENFLASQPSELPTDLFDRFRIEREEPSRWVQG